MKLHLILIGNKYIYNSSLQNYILRTIEKNGKQIDKITYFKKSDNSLFLYLEEELNKKIKLLIVTSKQHFSTVGKLISTATADNQILKEGMLIPSNAAVYEERSYLLSYKNSEVNVLQVDEGERLPQILLNTSAASAAVHIFDEDENTINTILQPIAQTYDVSFSATQIVQGWLRVDISSNKYGDISNFMHAAKKLLPSKMIPSANVFEYIIETLSRAQKKITFAESCTGGLLTYMFTKHNGASKILEGSLVTYSNFLKENWLAVSEDILQKHGAVSAEVVEEMSEGALSVSSADYSISISGIAGEGGGSDEKPVGTVYIGVRSKENHQEKRCFFQGDRNYIQEQSALYAVKMLISLDKEMFF